jgi:hypothetical protein
MPRFPGSTSGTDYIIKILDKCVRARAPGEDFNISVVLPQRSAIYLKVSNIVYEASVSYIVE